VYAQLKIVDFALAEMLTLIKCLLGIFPQRTKDPKSAVIASFYQPQIILLRK